MPDPVAAKGAKFVATKGFPPDAHGFCGSAGASACLGRIVFSLSIYADHSVVLVTQPDPRASGRPWRSLSRGDVDRGMSDLAGRNTKAVLGELGPALGRALSAHCRGCTVGQTRVQAEGPAAPLGASGGTVTAASGVTNETPFLPGL